jgi:hypothetical protein
MMWSPWAWSLTLGRAASVIGRYQGGGGRGPTCRGLGLREPHFGST